MASRCQYCHKGRAYGHMVSHAKNRLKRIFYPNLQKLKVLQEGLAISVVFCTRCIKRLKKDGKIGPFDMFRIVEPKVKIDTAKLMPAIPEKKEKPKEEKAKETLDIAAIVGKKK